MPLTSPPATTDGVTRRAIALTAALATAAALVAGPAALPAAAQDTEPADPTGPVVTSTVSDTLVVQPAGGVSDPVGVALRLSQATFADGAADEVVLATARTFADALASGSLQGTDTPLLLTQPDALPAAVAAEIERLGADAATILGGTEAVDADVAEELEDLGLDVDRIAGPTRFETATAIAGTAAEATTAIVARGFGSAGDDTQAFADALAAGGWAAEEGWPVLLTSTDELAEATAERLDASPIEDVFLLGGELAIAPAVEEAIVALGIDVTRVTGLTRFDTAAAVAARRGFDDARDADRVILVEGQAADAWAAGFAAAAHAAIVPAPILLASGDTLPDATADFLAANAPTPDGSAGDDPGFAVDVDPVDEPVLICAAAPAACEQARVLLGLPAQATLALVTGEEPVPSRSQLLGSLDLHGAEATAAIFGECVEEGLVVPDEDGAIALDVVGRPGDCDLQVEVAFANGTVQILSTTIEVGPAEPLTGTVTDTETGGDAYTFVPDGADAPVLVDYTAEDMFEVDGEPATIGAFEASVTVADRITFTADTEDGSVHSLTNVDPQTLTSGTVGDVDLSAGTFAIIEPVTGVALRPALQITDGQTFAIGGSTVDRARFEADVNEGDRIQVAGSALRLTNETVRGAATAITVDAISGIARFRAGGLGDDPLNAEDDRFRARAGTDQQTFRVDGAARDFAGFAAALSEGDEVTYRRTAGVEAFELTNRPQPPVVGLVTETVDPDGSPVAPEPADGGSIVVLTVEGRQAVAYSADATFRIDGAVATEQEFEAARTPGDEVAYQPADPGTGTAEAISLDEEDLTGEVTDITEGANTYDVRVRAGVVYDDLDYTAGLLGGSDTYVINGSTVGLAAFENELALIDRGAVLGTVVVRAVAGGTEHRLTTEDR